MSTIALLELLSRDGIGVPSGDEADREIVCFNPNHDSSSKTMTINVVDGSYYCPCGAEGTALTYLTKIRKLDEKESRDILLSLGWDQARIERAEELEAGKRRKSEGLPKLLGEIPESMGKIPRVASYEYHSPEGVLLCTRAVYLSKKARKKKIFTFTPAKRGGYWLCEPVNKALPDEDRRIDTYPLYRADRLQGEIADERRQVWLVHDEATADAVAAIPCDPKVVDGPVSGPPPVTCIFGNKQNIFNTDLATLFSRRVIVIAETNPASCTYMRKVGIYLHHKGCAVRYLLPPGEGGYSLHSALSEGGFKAAMEWIRKIGPIAHDSDNPLFASSKESPLGTAAKVFAPLERTKHFRVLGFNGDDVVFQIMDMNRIFTCRASQISMPGVLIQLAPTDYWEELGGPEGLSNSKNRLAFCNSILRAAAKCGEYNPALNNTGRGGGLLEDGRAFFHLGDRLLLANEDSKKLEEEASLDFEDERVFLPRPKIKLKESDKGREYLREAYEALIQYRFMTAHHARAFMGFIVTSLMGGLLEFRPMLWLLGRADTGKTYLLRKFMFPLLGDTVIKTGNITEAGLIKETMGDSLPVCIDEFEPGTGRVAKEKYSNLLQSVRLAFSGEYRRIRGGGGGGGWTPDATLRFSMILASIDRPVLTDAEHSRFFFCRLNPVPLSHDKWPEVRDALEASVKGDRGIIIRSAIIRDAARIAETARELEDRFSPLFKKQRDCHVISALTAGAGYASGNYEMISPSSSDENNTTLTPLEMLLGSLVQTPQPRTLMECLTLSTWGRYYSEDSVNQYVRHENDMPLADVASRYGFKISYDRFSDYGIELYVALGMKSMKDLLRGTEAENYDLDNYLQNMPGVENPKTINGSGTTRRKRVRIGGAQRYVVIIPNSILCEIGLVPENAPADPREIAMDRGNY